MDLSIRESACKNNTGFYSVCLTFLCSDNCRWLAILTNGFITQESSQ